MTTLGRLEQVELRNVWVSEAGDFTPWLAREENLKLLGDAVRIELELEGLEQNVGPFRADILCKDTATGNWVLIENQLQRTDHTHLGQLLTYAAGLKAVSIVWIADHFTEEHRAALDWLNEITDERFNFFGLEVELWRIGQSPIAPKFNIISQPNDWSRTITKEAKKVETENLSPGKQLQLEFWTAFRKYASEHAQRIKPTKPFPQHWMTIALGKTGTCLFAVASMYDSQRQSFDGHEVRAEVITDGDEAKAFFALLHAMSKEIEADLGEPLIWHNPEGKNMCRIYLRKSVDLNDRGKWDQYQAWLVEKLDALHRVFASRIKQLDAAEWVNDTEVSQG
jgi:hypothetical protein